MYGGRHSKNYEYYEDAKNMIVKLCDNIPSDLIEKIWKWNIWRWFWLSLLSNNEMDKVLNKAYNYALRLVFTKNYLKALKIFDLIIIF